MYFKNTLNLKNQYEYLKYMYKWGMKKIEVFENSNFNPYNTSYRWMNNGIPDTIFSLPLSEENVIDLTYAFDMCYDNLKNSLCLVNSQKLSEVIYTIIFKSETDVSQPFTWDKDIHKYMKQIYENYNCVQMLCILLIYAQTQKICTPNGRYQLRNNFSYIKVYKKETINQNFNLLLEDAVEMNMSQISIPSLLESYNEFFKRKNKEIIMNALTENPDFRMKILMIDPSVPNIDLLMHTYMFGDTFSDSVKVIEDSIDFSASLMKRFPNQVTAKTVAVPMSYSFMQIRNKNSPSIMKIDIYTPFNNVDERFSMIFDDLENKELYDYYSKTFYRMFYNGNLIHI